MTLRKRFGTGCYSSRPLLSRGELAEITDVHRRPSTTGSDTKERSNGDTELTSKSPFLRYSVSPCLGIKSMTIDGYYTTEIGLKQELGDDGQLFLGQFPGCTHPEHS